MESDKFFWDAVIVLIAAAAGVGGKIFYDMLRFKAPPREGPDKKKFPGEYDADVCALRHNELDKDISTLTKKGIRVNCTLIFSAMQALQVVGFFRPISLAAFARS